MKVVTTNLLNRFWKNGVMPIKNALVSKFDTSKIVKSANITEEGFVMDGKTASEQFAELNGNIETLASNVFLKTEGFGSIASGMNLNTVTVPGLYFCTGTDGRPVSSDGFMIVMSHSNGARGVQIYFPYIGGMWKRIKSSDTWGNWAQISNV